MFICMIIDIAGLQSRVDRSKDSLQLSPTNSGGEQFEIVGQIQDTTKA